MKTIRIRNIFKQAMKIILLLIILLFMMLFLFEIIFILGLWYKETHMN